MTEERPVTSDQQTWSVLAHASAFIQLIGIPSVVGPFVVWLLKRTDPVVEMELHARGERHNQNRMLERHSRSSTMGCSDGSVTPSLHVHHHPSDSPTSATRPPPTTPRT